MGAEKIIEVLGPGCPRCKETYRVVQHVVEREQLPFQVVKNESVERMIQLGVMMSPALAVGGKVVLAGRVPRAEEVHQLLHRLAEGD